MVRRWSYIKDQNSNKNLNFSDLSFVHGEVSFLSNVYFRKTISHQSKLTRKSWAKRKHLSNWLPLQSVLSDWSNDYLFFKKYNKMVLTLNLFKNSFLSFNFLLLKKTSTLLKQNSESFFFTFPSKRLLSYFSRNFSSTYKFLINIRHTPLMYISTPESVQDIRKKLPMLGGSSFGWSGQLFFNQQDAAKLHSLELIFATLNNAILIKNVELYKVLTLLTLNQVCQQRQQ